MDSSSEGFSVLVLVGFTWGIALGVFTAIPLVGWRTRRGRD